MWWLLAVLGVVLLGAALWGPIVSNVEQPKYKIIESKGNIEIRDYAQMIVAETDVAGERDEAISKGFRIIANYIFGNNSATQKVPMTAPVTQQGSEKIAMTAPVTQQGEGNTWKVRFIMPSSYSMETLPKPSNPTVELKEVPAKRFVVIRFSGLGGDENLKHHTTSSTTSSGEEPHATIAPDLRLLQSALDLALPAPQRSADRDFRCRGGIATGSQDRLTLVHATSTLEILRSLFLPAPVIVRFGVISGHQNGDDFCPLSANSGHYGRRMTAGGRQSRLVTSAFGGPGGRGCRGFAPLKDLNARRRPPVEIGTDVALPKA